jgi:hypothetical protein
VVGSVSLSPSTHSHKYTHHTHTHTPQTCGGSQCASCIARLRHCLCLLVVGRLSPGDRPETPRPPSRGVRLCTAAVCVALDRDALAQAHMAPKPAQVLFVFRLFFVWDKKKAARVSFSLSCFGFQSEAKMPFSCKVFNKCLQFFELRNRFFSAHVSKQSSSQTDDSR